MALEAQSSPRGVQRHRADGGIICGVDSWRVFCLLLVWDFLVNQKVRVESQAVVLLNEAKSVGELEAELVETDNAYQPPAS